MSGIGKPKPTRTGDPDHRSVRRNSAWTLESCVGPGSISMESVKRIATRSFNLQDSGRSIEGFIWPMVGMVEMYDILDIGYKMRYFAISRRICSRPPHTVYGQLPNRFDRQNAATLSSSGAGMNVSLI